MQKYVIKKIDKHKSKVINRSGSRTAATSKMEHFVIIVNNGWNPLIIITKSSILDTAAFLDPPLIKTIITAVEKLFIDISGSSTNTLER